VEGGAKPGRRDRKVEAIVPPLEKRAVTRPAALEEEKEVPPVRRDGPGRLVVVEALAARRDVDVDAAAESTDEVDVPRVPDAATRRGAGRRGTDDAAGDRVPNRPAGGDPEEPCDGIPTIVRPEMPRLSSSTSSTRRPRRRSAAVDRRGEDMEFVGGDSSDDPAKGKGKNQRGPRC
jgi:hypothetical protein